MNNNISSEMMAINIILKKYPKIKKYLFVNDKLRVSSNILISESRYMSSGEQVIVKISLDLWDSSGNTLFRDIYQVLDSANYMNVLEAVNLKRQY